ncbi:MAG: PIN domain-containing protein [Variibacter sp.]
MSADDFFDTNVVVYLLSADRQKADIAERLLMGGGVVSVQVLNEFASVVTRKFGLGMADLREALARIQAVCTAVPLDVETHALGLDVAERYHLAIYDAMIVAAALRSGCRVLHTEDLNSGQVGQLIIRNPFL